MKRLRLTVIERWLLLIMLGAIILTLLPHFETVKAANYRQECVANLISITIALRLYEVKEGVEYHGNTTEGLFAKGYLFEEFTCPATSAYYRIDTELDIPFCPSGITDHTWP